MSNPEFILLAEASDSLEWRRMKGEAVQWQLRDRIHGGLVALLSWPAGMAGPAHAEMADGVYIFKRISVPRRIVSVKREGENTELASLVVGWFGRSYLQLDETVRYPWSPINLWKGRWGYTDAQGISIMRFRPKLKGKKRRIRIRFDPILIGTPDLPLLLLTGGYQLVALGEEG